MQINKIIQFRQEIYEMMGQAKDAQFDLLDALLASKNVNSFVELSVSPLHQRQWHSAYAAMEKGTLDERRWRELVVTQLPSQDVQVFSLDGSIWVHQRARTLEGLVLEPTSDKSHRVPCHLYSSLCWIPQAHSSWALPMSTERVPWVGSEGQTGLAQIADLCWHKQEQEDKSLTVITADGRYGNTPFLQSACDLPCTCVVRLRCDRLLYTAPPVYTGLGRPRVHGNKFHFSDEQTWHCPDDTQVIEDDRYGHVHLQVWHTLHAHNAPTATFSVIRAHVQHDTHSSVRWLAVTNYPQDYSLFTIWHWYHFRYSIEPNFHFRKHNLLWTRPRFQHTRTCDRWTQFVDMAVWLLFLARNLVADFAYPWQRPQSQLTPQRVKQGMSAFLPHLPLVSTPPKPRGKSPGWQRGRRRTPSTRYSVNIRSVIVPNSS